jgi:hypothetical protein
MPVILEGIVTTTNPDGSTNVAPMGPIVDEAMVHLILRPFQASSTFRNLAATRVGVFHVTDDVELIARSAIGMLGQTPQMTACDQLACMRLVDCCRWYAFRVESVDEREMRAQMQARVVGYGRVRDFFGFNRAKHAVLEAAILATRLHLLSEGEVSAEMARLRRIVEKTAGAQEARAFAVLSDYIASRVRSPGKTS